MAITTLDGFVAAAKQKQVYRKTATRTTVAGRWFSMRGDAGNPGAASAWSAGNTANGAVPTDASSGFPSIAAFGGGATGYLGAFGFSNTVVSRMRLADVVFWCGAYDYNANVTLASQPSFLGRIPGGAAANCVGLELWAECCVAPTGNLAVNVTYLNEAGASKSTGATGIGAAPTIGSMWQLPLAAGDKGVSQINNVTCSVATVGVGVVNVLLLRPLTPIVRVPVAYGGDVFDFLKGGMPIMYDTSAIIAQVVADSTSSGLPDWDFDIVNG